MRTPYADTIDEAVRTFPLGTALAATVEESADLQMLTIKLRNEKVARFRAEATTFFYGT